MDRVYQKNVGCLGSCNFSTRAWSVFFFLYFLFSFHPFSLLRLIFTSFYIYMGGPEVIAHDLLSDFTAHASIRPNKPVSVLVSLSGMLMSTGFLSPLLCLALCSV
ncbi:hypothetical protein BDV34DRAFT_13029 [Aspergillus parasiticus]|uniref:Uncharacterized protein n=1 Tax=Aspergillus parasiticus TaxID=5067 RepID=A0A5N6D8Y1_ASPPA|nr:hypothetical protein BDV34DRAFT_13029 [Aspergillus parasiticus]